MNCDNELNTIIDFESISDGIVFEIDNELCGKMKLDISKIVTNHKYLYLYNNDKKKYERLEVKDINNVTIDTAGKYLISFNNLSDKPWNLKYIIVGIGVLIIGILVYVVVKKRHWFW